MGCANSKSVAAGVRVPSNDRTPLNAVDVAPSAIAEKPVDMSDLAMLQAQVDLLANKGKAPKASRAVRGNVSDLFALKTEPKPVEKIHEILYPPDTATLPPRLNASAINERLGVSTGKFSHIGKREGQEDRVTVHATVRGDDSFIFAGVFDGHGGDAVASYLEQHLLDRIITALVHERQYARQNFKPDGPSMNAIEEAVTGVQQDDIVSTPPVSTTAASTSTASSAPNFMAEESSMVRNPIHQSVSTAGPRAHRLQCLYGSGEPDFRKLLTYVFHQIDKEIAAVDPQTISHTTGSCAAIMCIYGDALVVANVGDCEAWLCRAGRPYELTSPHTSTRESEFRRIKQTGGHVTYWRGEPRVGGALLVSRSIGMHALKKEYTGVIPDPFVRITQLKLPANTRIPPPPAAPTDIAPFETAKHVPVPVVSHPVAASNSSNCNGRGDNLLSPNKPIAVPPSILTEYANNSEADYPSIGRSASKPKRTHKPSGLHNLVVQDAQTHTQKPPNRTRAISSSSSPRRNTVLLRETKDFPQQPQDLGRPPLPLHRASKSNLAAATDLSRLVFEKSRLQHAGLQDHNAMLSRTPSQLSLQSEGSDTDDANSFMGFDIDDISDDDELATPDGLDMHNSAAAGVSREPILRAATTMTVPSPQQLPTSTRHNHNAGIRMDQLHVHAVGAAADTPPPPKTSVNTSSSGEDEFVVLGSDGLFDAFPNRQDLMNRIKAHLRDTNDVDATCERVVMEAIEGRNSQDNVSMVLVVLNQRNVVTATANALDGLVGYAARACARKIHARNTRNLKVHHEIHELEKSRDLASATHASAHLRMTSFQLADVMAGGVPAAKSTTHAAGRSLPPLAMVAEPLKQSDSDEEGDELDDTCKELQATEV